MLWTRAVTVLSRLKNFDFGLLVRAVFPSVLLYLVLIPGLTRWFLTSDDNFMISQTLCMSIVLFQRVTEQTIPLVLLI